MYKKVKFGELEDGREVFQYTLTNRNGVTASFLDLGGIWSSMLVPDANGRLDDVVLGYDTIEACLVNGGHLGEIVGRNANRIGRAEFTLNGVTYKLAANNGPNNLHSGPDGFEKKLWEVRHIDQDDNSVTLGRISPDGENGFPGEFNICVTYEFTEENAIRIVYSGVSDKTTIANMTNHSYFNLSGEGSGNVLDQYLSIHAQSYTPVGEGSIPLGENVPVEGTPMDFRREKQIGQDIEADFEQLKITGGYDHNYVTDGYTKAEIREIACARSEKTGIFMEALTDCPCVQFYAGNFIENENGKNGHIYQKRDGFCLETQVEPNAVNVENFHSPILEKGERYYSETVYRFSVKD